MNEMKTASGECPVCAGAIEERERLFCPRCETPHHQECYSYNRGCAIFGCNPEAVTTPVPKKPGMPATSWPMAALTIVMACVTFSYVVLRLTYTGCDLGRTLPQRTAPAPSTCTSPTVGCLAPDFTLKDIDGYEHSFRSHSRGHVSVLTIWLARCPDCLESFPKGVALSNEFAHKGVYFTDVAYMGTPESTAQWVKETGIKNPVLLDSDGAVVRTYQLGTYTCFVLDEQGVIRYRGPVGGAADAVRKLLKQDSGFAH